ncbi:hypothetical protein OG241_07385 [Streptomyces sp. NBC_01390]|uniref:hypothetical protein n=1 Tax=Streptomyces sp. NBC_01390 TaxID=2903850 RepID=UPI00325026AE
MGEGGGFDPTKPFEFVGNMIQSFDVLKNWVQAQDGLSVEGDRFVLRSPKPAAKAKRKPAGRRDNTSRREQSQLRAGETTASPPAPDVGWLDWHPEVFLVARTAGGKAGDAEAKFGVYAQDLGQGRVGCVATLINQTGFNSAFGDQVVCRIGGEMVDDNSRRRMVTFEGWINPVGPGFGRFAGAVLVSVDQGRLKVEPGGCSQIGQGPWRHIDWVNSCFTVTVGPSD